jgi:predicted DNA-binding protein (MmcQ/YjbR family)
VTRDQLLAHCLAKPGAWEDEPWEGDVVAKVGSKIFAFLGAWSASQPPTLGLKCGAGREAADEWLLRYPDDASVMPYIGRFGWNSLRIGGAIPDGELLEAVDASYQGSRQQAAQAGPPGLRGAGWPRLAAGSRRPGRRPVR